MDESTISILICTDYGCGLGNMKVSILKQHMIIIVTLCYLENITLTLDFHELIFLHVVGGNVNIQWLKMGKLIYQTS